MKKTKSRIRSLDSIPSPEQLKVVQELDLRFAWLTGHAFLMVVEQAQKSPSLEATYLISRVLTLGADLLERRGTETGKPALSDISDMRFLRDGYVSTMEEAVA